MNKTEYSAVFISPHLDDAVFSCGGKIADLTLKKKVFVLNVFTSFDENIQDRAVVFGEERLQEEKNASKVLNYDFLNLQEKDAYFRGFRKGSIAKVFYPPTAEDFIYLDYLRKKIFEVLSQISFEEIYVPLAIGWHIDHYLIHLIFNDHKNQFYDKIRFYEDVPYVFFPGARIERLTYLQKQPARLSENLLSISKSFFHSGFTQNIKKYPWRYLIMPFMTLYFLKLILLHRKVRSHNFFFNIIPEHFNCELHYELKISAVMCYQTQVKEFFKDEGQVRTSYTNYSKNIAPKSLSLERYWIPKF